MHSVKAFAICFLVLLHAFRAVAQVLAPLPTHAVVSVMPLLTMTPVVVSAVIPLAGSCGLTPLPDVVGPLVNPTQVQFDDPAMSGRSCRLPLPTVPFGGPYRAFVTVRAQPCGTLVMCESELSAHGIPSFTVVDPCADLPVLNVGDWTRRVPRGGYVRVQFSLMQSRQPVTVVRLSVGGLEQSRITSADLRFVAGAYFSVPSVVGRYVIAIEASDGRACPISAQRQMTVEVF
jgi:hypothetical protein